MPIWFAVLVVGCFVAVFQISWWKFGLWELLGVIGVAIGCFLIGGLCVLALNLIPVGGFGVY